MRKYIIKILNGMALGLFSSLIIGLIIKQVGILANVDFLISIGSIAQLFMGAAIGVGVAYSLDAKSLVLISAVVAGSLGAGSIRFVDGKALLQIGEPVGALFSSWISVEIGNRIIGKTKVDIVIIPFIVIIIGGLVGNTVSPYIATFMNGIGKIINFATEQQPIVMGIIISTVMGIALTMPISSAAIGIALNLNGLAAGAALVGCCCHMVGFAVSSYRENKFGGLISQGIGTSMIQISNIIKNPRIMLPPVFSSIILGPIATTIFQIKSSPIGSGMGTSGLVGIISTYEVMRKDSLLQIILICVILPSILSLIFSEYMRKKSYIKSGDMKLN
ncbi:hypothetical protein HMPREF9709_00652 [Helcococcus kunzii ATCC 51366]|uniref:Phosphotransferase system EIIC domain-containing protein n=1 Tax=Helcococcus kunzii ATCC 51366 TaxID=883114 RepID=H3NMU1_9FIRM|nr:PTS sugar transporter subunit IIC [Helcococcus kunzii]EHR34682.1 hypothetical protein HMPREF9709_00652 [Helcococcus kunzii ATCC 51366]